MYSTRAFTLDVALVCCFLTGEGTFYLLVSFNIWFDLFLYASGEGEATASSHTSVDGRETIEEEIVNEDGCSGK
ncbi:hypothetical protein HID58_049130 [Brassica napus]|uniref:Uncharacterized protein n=1 Tax=Brassica napus TaxID=3708 RepID=A0ABQ8B445_BRANA|nr:hypothetical protein HID58_049130 [Brassica napus]